MWGIPLNPGKTCEILIIWTQVLSGAASVWYFHFGTVRPVHSKGYRQELRWHNPCPLVLLIQPHQLGFFFCPCLPLNWKQQISPNATSRQLPQEQRSNLAVWVWPHLMAHKLNRNGPFSPVPFRDSLLRSLSVWMCLCVWEKETDHFSGFPINSQLLKVWSRPLFLRYFDSGLFNSCNKLNSFAFMVQVKVFKHQWWWELYNTYKRQTKAYPANLLDDDSVEDIHCKNHQTLHTKSCSMPCSFSLAFCKFCILKAKTGF